MATLAKLDPVKRLGLLAALLLAACQPEAHRALVLDLTLSDPLVLESTTAPWHAAGYHVEYRRFYPHLTRADLARYRTVIVLGGSGPKHQSDALTIGDLAILTEWIWGGRDGVVVLGYGADSATQDRWIMNRWLAAEGSGIAIGSQALDVPAVPLPRSALDNAGFAPFPAGTNQVLQVRDRSQALARAETAGSPLVAASRVGEGLLVVASRNLLAAGKDDRGTRDFLVALARWTRRPAEWAGVAPAMHPLPLTLSSAPRPLLVHPPPLAPPKGVAVMTMPEAIVPRPPAERPTLPNWIARQGMRVVWSRYAPYAVDSLIRFVEAASLNALATVIPFAALDDTLGTRNIWKSTVERLQATSLRWFPAVALKEIPTQGADEVDRHGELVPVPCGLDSLFWRGALRPAYRALARLGGARPDLIVGVALDLDGAGTNYGDAGFCDGDYRLGLGALGLDRGDVERLTTLPPTVRYDTLLERGLLDRYVEALEDAVAERAMVLRAELRRVHPDLLFAFHASEVPADWFSLGLLRGLSSSEAPVLVWLRERHGRELLQRYRARGIFALSAWGLDPERVAAAEWPRLRSLVFGEHDGFWLEKAPADSVDRQIRRLAR